MWSEGYPELKDPRETGLECNKQIIPAHKDLNLSLVKAIVRVTPMAINLLITAVIVILDSDVSGSSDFKLQSVA